MFLEKVPCAGSNGCGAWISLKPCGLSRMLRIERKDYVRGLFGRVRVLGSNPSPIKKKPQPKGLRFL